MHRKKRNNSWCSSDSNSSDDDILKIPDISPIPILLKPNTININRNRRDAIILDEKDLEKVSQKILFSNTNKSKVSEKVPKLNINIAEQKTDYQNKALYKEDDISGDSWKLLN